MCDRKGFKVFKRADALFLLDFHVYYREVLVSVAKVPREAG